MNEFGERRFEFENDEFAVASKLCSEYFAGVEHHGGCTRGDVWWEHQRYDPRAERFWFDFPACKMLPEQFYVHG